MPDRNVTLAALTQAFAAHLKSGAEVLAAWRARLSPEEETALVEDEQKGLRLGLSINMPADRFVIQIFLLDAAGGTRVVGQIDQGGAQLNTSIN